MATILPFVSGSKKGWSQAEQAEFIRATEILRGTGLPVITESGLSDEGDPWTIFLREDTGDVVVHISKIDGCVVATSAASDDVVSGPSFRAVMNRIIRSQPLVLPTTRSGDKVYLHPSAVITAFIATALVWSFSEEANVQQYHWAVAGDGNLQPTVAPRATQSSSILRDAVLAKADVGMSAHDAGALSNRFVMAASVAAVAMVADYILKGSAPDDVQSAATDAPSETDASVAATAPREAEYVFEPGDDTLLPSPQRTDTRPVWIAEDTNSGLEFSGIHQEANFLRTDWPQQSSPPPNASIDGYPVLDGPSERGRITLFDQPAAQDLTRHVTQAEHVPDVVEKPTSASPPASVPGSNWAKSGGHILFSADATELLVLLFSPSELGNGQSIQGDIALAYDLKFDPVELALGSEQGPQSLKGPAVAETTTADRGYKLLGDILAFAFDNSKELSPSPVLLQNFAQALKANSFLPSAERVVVIDVPDLRADAFRLTDDIVMISQDLATQLLPDLPLQPKAEIGLAGGTTLKLIGVIDMVQDTPGQIV